jgi:glycerophosphoryl diester phosphodiesterase
VVAAASPVALTEFKGGSVALCGARPDISALRWRSVLGLGAGPRGYRMLSVPRSYRGIPVATRSFFRTATAAGVPVHVWTVDDPTTARALWAAGAAGVVTNDPAAIVRARDAS